jgi:hypothetical protein
VCVCVCVRVWGVYIVACMCLNSWRVCLCYAIMICD